MRVKSAEYVKDYKIKFLFSDGIAKVVDFKQFFCGNRKLLMPLLELDYFKGFYVDEITICWPNGLDFSPDVLYDTGESIKEPKNPVKTPIRSGRQKTVGKTRLASKPFAIEKKSPKKLK